MARKSSTAAPKAPAKGAAKAAPAAASATAEQLGHQPAATTDNAATIASAPPGDTALTVSEATAALEGGAKGPDAPIVLIVGGLPAAQYIEALKAGGVDVLPLAELDEPLLRQLGQFLVIGDYDLLPPDQLVLQIEQAVGIEPLSYPAGVSGGDDPLASALSELQGGVAKSASLADSEVPAVLSAGGEPTDTVDDSALDDDGDVEGLWITAVPEQGFRRCGFRFTREGFAIALDALTPAQIEQLENEPNLKVERGIFGGQVEVQ